MDEKPLTGVCLFCGDRVNNLEQHYMENHHSVPAAPTGTTGVCLFCGDRVNNLEQHYMENHHSTPAAPTGVICPVCGDRVNSMKAMEVHKFDVHPTGLTGLIRGPGLKVANVVISLICLAICIATIYWLVVGHFIFAGLVLGGVIALWLMTKPQQS